MGPFAWALSARHENATLRARISNGGNDGEEAEQLEDIDTGEQGLIRREETYAG